MRFLSDIIRNSYSPAEVRKCIRAEDIWNYDLDSQKLEEMSKNTSNAFFSGNSAVGELKVTTLGNNHIFCPGNIYDELCLRRTNQILKNALRTPTLNRDDEVRQLLHILDTEPRCNVFRTDIKSYFESVPLETLIAKLETDGFRNNCSINHLKNLNSFLVARYSYHGLPRGLAISSTLADYALYDFDHDIYDMNCVVYYTRYVDDICVVHFSEAKQFETAFDGKIPYSLKLNSRKTQHLEVPSDDSLEFLGYCISLKKPQVITIASAKIAKAKTRIVLALRRFAREKNFPLLLDRLRFLSCSIRMTKVGRRSFVYTGYRNVYRFCTEAAVSKQLSELDTFLHGILWSKRYSLSRSIQQHLSKEERQLLKTISFEQNYASKLVFTMDPQKISRIKQAWKYE